MFNRRLAIVLFACFISGRAPAPSGYAQDSSTETGDADRVKALVTIHRDGKFYQDFVQKTRHIYFLQGRAIISV